MIPTYNRSHDLSKLVYYFAKNFSLSTVKIIVLDGSDNDGEVSANKSVSENNSIEYCHYGSEISYLQRILDGLKQVGTETVALLGDDDILDPKGFSNCVTFLQRNPDYAVAHGQYIGFDFRANGLSFNKTYQSNSVEEDFALERLFSFFSAYTAPTYYAVNRTRYIRKSFEELVANGTEFKDYVSSELLVSAIPLAHGKLKKLDFFYQARRFIPAPPDKYIVYAKYILDEGFSNRYNKLKKSIIKYLPETEKNDSDTVSDAIDYAFAAYFGQRISTNELRSRFQALNIIR